MASAIYPVENETLSSDNEFSNISTTEISENHIKHKPRNTNTLEKDTEEDTLEYLVLKRNNASWIDRLLEQPYHVESINPSSKDGTLVLDVDNDSEIDDADLFAFDAEAPIKTHVIASKNGVRNEEGAAWYDSDDDRIVVSLASNKLLRKLRHFEGEDLITGSEYIRRLREQYKKLHPQPQWAKTSIAEALKKEENRESPIKRPRHSIDRNENQDSDDEENLSSLPLSQLLSDIRSFKPLSGRRQYLKPETINIQRSRNIADSYTAPVTSLQFHPSYSSILMSSSKCSLLRLHRIDPIAQPIPNPTIATIQLARTPILRACFSGAHDIRMAGRRPYMHSWNLDTGSVSKTNRISGENTKLEHKTFENFRPSPCGKFVAILGSRKKGGSTISILNADTMMWNAEARMDSRHGVADFAWWSSGDGLTILGSDGSIGEYSIVEKMFVTTWIDEGNIGGTTLTLGGVGGPPLLGRDKWLVVGSKSGIVNIYDRKALFTSVSRGIGAELLVSVAGGGRPKPVKTLEQLITRITTLELSPDGQLLIVASKYKKDALKMVHLPSCKVYRNWPTAETPLGRVTAVAISKDNYLVVGNDTGKIRLWEIRN